MKKNSKLVTAIILAVTFIACAALAFTAIIANIGGDPANSRSGVVLIASVYKDPNTGETTGSTGTGWAIGKKGSPVQYFVTNGHVVEGVKTYGGYLSIYYSVAENDVVSPQLVYYSAPSDKDIAILKIPEPTTKRKALDIRSSSTVNIGETAYALGYPGVAMDSQSYNSLDENDISVTRGIISKSATPVGVSFDAFQMDVPINHGNSGGPLVDSGGFVIGINTLGSNKTENLNYAIKTDVLTRILREEGIATSFKGENNWMIYLFAPLAVIALAGAIVMFILSGKGGTKGAPSAAASQPRSGAGSKPVLRGVSGRFAGESFSLGSGRLTIGRNSVLCNIIFEENTAGISGNHCSVVYDSTKNVFVLTDNGSTYGTFLADGRKLAPNVPEMLNAGDMFCLADKSIQFIVTME